MALSIKNEKADRLARELAGLMDTSITTAILTALENELERQRPSRTNVGDALRELAREIAKYPVLDDRDPDEILYDEFGLPR